MRSMRRGAISIAAIFCLEASAQESVNQELDACIRTEQVRMTAKGAAVGALAGLLKSSFADQKKKNDTLKNVAAGAVIGGVAGFITAYYKAVGNCYGKNPAWVPESKVQRSAGYEQAKAALGYRPEMGPVAKLVRLDMAGTVRPGTRLPVLSRLVALTPDGSEPEVVIERRLFATADGKEIELTFPGHTREQRKLEPGEMTDEVYLPVPAEATAGTVFRYQISLSPVSGGAPSVLSASTTVQ